MDSATSLLESAHDAMARHDWRAALDSFAASDASHPLQPDELEAMSEAAFWSGLAARALECRQRAFTGYLDADRQPEAAEAAVAMCRLHFGQHDTAAAWGWLGRARRLLDDLPECAGHGELAWLEGQLMLLLNSYDQALERSHAVQAIANQIRSRDLAMLGIAMEGFIRARTGDATGIHLIDEALAAAVAGELGPFATAEIFCDMVVSCIELTDYTRAAEWLDTAERLGRDIVCFPGCCRVHRATVLRHQGDWETAHREAHLARAELAGIEVIHEGMALCEIGELYRRKGETRLAQRTFEEAYELGWPPPPGLALILLAEGDAAGAAHMVSTAVERFSNEPGALLLLLPAQVEVALVTADTSLAQEAARRLADIAAELGTPTAKATCECAGGTVAQMTGDLVAAMKQLELGVRLWNEARNPYEAARARLRLASVLEAMDDTGSARLELSTARRTFERLGALREAGEAAKRLGDEAPRRAGSTFMFTDIVNSTSLLTTVGDDAWHSLRRWHDNAVGSIVAQHRGRIVKQTGDGVFATFDDPGLAVECAIAIQRTLDQHRHTHGFSPSVRIGMHTGVATVIGDDYAGKDVVIAARISALAGAEEILVSALLAEQAAAGSRADRTWSASLKGIPEPTEVASIAWR